MQTNPFATKPLSELCDLVNGYAFKPEDWSSIGLPIIRIQNLNGGHEFNYCPRVPSEAFVVESGTLLFSWSGNRGTSFGPRVWPGPRGLLNQHIFKVIPHVNVDPQWLFYALDLARDQAERRAHGGSGLVHVRRMELLGYRVPTPLPYQQAHIARILLAADEAIAKTEALIAKLKQVKQGLLHDLLTRGLDKNGKLRDPLAHPEEFRDSALGRIPRDWDVEQVGCVFDIQLGKMLSSAARSGRNSYPYLANRNVQWDTADLSELEMMDFTPEERAKFALEPGDLLVCEGGEVGRTAIWQGELHCCYYQKAIHRLRPKTESVSPDYCLMFMHRASEMGWFTSFTSQTSIAHLTREKLMAMPICLPQRPEQNRITIAYKEFVECILAEEAYLVKLEHTKKRLMHDLLTGRVLAHWAEE